MFRRQMQHQQARFRILESGDPKTHFPRLTARQILERHGPPKTILSLSAKAEKCTGVGVLNRVLYFTPGIFCPAATSACRAACLGHTSGNMQLPGSALARDQRSALYLEDRDVFLQILRTELHKLRVAAKRQGMKAAVRLNGTSDLPWERLHPQLFADFPDISFFDYTKLRPRMHAFLSRRLNAGEWPSNYHLTFSGDGNLLKEAKEMLARGGNVALVFWPKFPTSWQGHQVVNGDAHDARFLDPEGVVVGLHAKGIARVDLEGFVIRPCPSCELESEELNLVSIHEDTHRETLHRCAHCGWELRAWWILPHALKRFQWPALSQAG
jgi:hypothetical protein